MPTGILTTRQVAEMLNVDVSTISRWVAAGSIPYCGRHGDGRTSAIMFDANKIAIWTQQLNILHTTTTKDTT